MKIALIANLHLYLQFDDLLHLYLKMMRGVEIRMGWVTKEFSEGADVNLIGRNFHSFRYGSWKETVFPVGSSWLLRLWPKCDHLNLLMFLLIFSYLDFRWQAFFIFILYIIVSCMLFSHWLDWLPTEFVCHIAHTAIASVVIVSHCERGTQSLNHFNLIRLVIFTLMIEITFSFVWMEPHTIIVLFPFCQFVKVML